MNMFKLVMTTERDCFQFVKSTWIGAFKLYGKVVSVWPVDVENDHGHLGVIWLLEMDEENFNKILEVFKQNGRTVTYCEGYYIT